MHQAVTRVGVKKIKKVGGYIVRVMGKFEKTLQGATKKDGPKKHIFRKTHCVVKPRFTQPLEKKRLCDIQNLENQRRGKNHLLS